MHIKAQCYATVADIQALMAGYTWGNPENAFSLSGADIADIFGALTLAVKKWPDMNLRK